jgi:hypothetical protein
VLVVFLGGFWLVGLVPALRKKKKQESERKRKGKRNQLRFASAFFSKVHVG